MEKFLLDYYIYILYTIQLVAVVVGLISYKKYKGTAGTFFIFIIFYLFIVELIGTYPFYYKKLDFLEPVYHSIFRNNYWWYTIFFDIGVIVLFSILFLKILKIKLHIIILKIIMLAFILFASLFLIINNQIFFFKYFPVLQIIGALIIISSSVLYFVELLRSDKLLEFYETLYFYIASSILIWWITATPISFYDLYFRNEDWNFIVLRWQIYLFTNFIMYTTFAIGLIVSKPEKNN